MQAPNTPNGGAPQVKIADRPASRFDLEKRASALLSRSGFDAVTGARMDKQYRRNKRAEAKVAARRCRQRKKKHGKFGAASPVRQIEPATREAEDPEPSVAAPLR